MTGNNTESDAKKQSILAEMKEKLQSSGDRTLRPAEAVMLLQWAIETKDDSHCADLIRLFGFLGGVRLMQDAFRLS